MAPVILLFSDLRQNGLLLTLDLRQNGLLLTLDLRQNGPILSPTCANVGPFYLRTCANKAFLFPAACATVFVFEYSGNTVGSKPNASGKLGRRSFLGMIKVGHKTDFLFLRYLRYPGPEPAQRLFGNQFLEFSIIQHLAGRMDELLGHLRAAHGADNPQKESLVIAKCILKISVIA